VQYGQGILAKCSKIYKRIKMTQIFETGGKENEKYRNVCS
jgi:hypothetical protein